MSAWPHRLQIQRVIPKFLKASPEPFRGEVLEVGAGAGWTSREILETYPQIELTATDIDAVVVSNLAPLQKKYGNRLHVKQADAANLPFDRASFDIVVASHTMHHISDLTVAIQQFLRVLRPGGLIGISDEDQNFVVGPLKWLWPTLSNVSRKQVEALLQAEGAEIQAAVGDIHFFVWARKPYPDQNAVS